MEGGGAIRPGLIGRDAELAAGRRALASDDRLGVVLVGEPGVGKTFLARRLLEEQAADPGAEVLWVVASGAEPAIPFGPFAPIVPEIGALPGRRPDPFFLLQSLRRAVIAGAEGRRLVIGVDDAHRLDGYSATLLFQLVANDGVRAVVAMRAGTTVPEAVRSLWKEGLLSRVDVTPLDEPGTLELAAAMLAGDLPERAEARWPARAGTSVGAALGRALWQVSGGNPLFLRELVLVGRQQGRITAARGAWSLTGPLEVGPRLTELLQERLDRTTPEEMAALEVVASADPIPLKVLVRLAGAADVDSLQRAGLLRVERSHGEHIVRSGHPLYAEAVRRAIPVTRARDLATALADAFEADGRIDSELQRIATWRLEAGMTLPADQLTEAAFRAAECQDWARAEEFARAAVRSGGGAPARFARAEALRVLGRPAEALAALDDRGGPGAPDGEWTARLAVLRATVLAFGLDRFDEAEWSLAAARREVTGPAPRAWLEAVAAGLAVFAGRPAHALPAALQALASGAAATGDADGRRVRNAASGAAAVALALTGRLGEATAVLGPERPEVGSWSSGSSGGAWADTARIVILTLGGMVVELQELAEAEHRFAVQIDSGPGRVRAAAVLGWTALARGDLSEAVARFREAMGRPAGSDPFDAAGPATLGLVQALALAGDARGAEEVLESGTDAGIPGPAGRRQLGRAWVAAARGEVGAAVAVATEAGARAAAGGDPLGALLAVHAAARLGAAPAAGSALDAAARLEGPLAAAVVEHARALAARAGGGDALDEVAGRYASLGLDLYAAEAAAHAARVHRQAGSARKAAAAAARAQLLIAAHDLAAPPHADRPRPLTVALALTPSALTRREREVALMAARGGSSQAIADSLCVSVRTVDTHLARVYYKLGITGRRGLSAALQLTGGPESVAP